LKEESAKAAAAEITAAGGTAIGIAANVLEKESLEAARAIVEEKFGICDILINGAG
jgi:NAD(P)-dependent dehydrogenase (short-subunit alcohol dehydrogenase family)